MYINSESESLRHVIHMYRQPMINDSPFQNVVLTNVKPVRTDLHTVKRVMVATIQLNRRTYALVSTR